MATSKVGPWATEKLARLQKYLNAYTTILRKRKFEGFYYIDAFAGPGEHEIRKVQRQGSDAGLFDLTVFQEREREQKEFIAGSPRVALELQYPFSGYVFVEMNPERVAELESLKAEFRGSRKIAVRQADCNNYLLKSVVASPKIDWDVNRAIVFLDPFGMQVPWGTLEALAQTRAIEVCLNFPVGMAIQRLLPRDSGKITHQRRAMLDEYFGSPDWFRILYRTRQNLFDEPVDEKIRKSGIALLNWYRERLRKAFGYASKAALIRNTRGAHLYYLLLAGPNPTGVKIFNNIVASAGEVA